METDQNLHAYGNVPFKATLSEYACQENMNREHQYETCIPDIKHKFSYSGQNTEEHKYTRRCACISRKGHACGMLHKWDEPVS